MKLLSPSYRLRTVMERIEGPWDRWLEHILRVVVAEISSLGHLSMLIQTSNLSIPRLY